MKRIDKRWIKALAVMLSTLALARASRLNPVTWSVPESTITATPGSTVLAKLHATVESGYHLYSQTTPEGGPTRTRISIAENSVITAFDPYQPTVNRHMDPTLGVTVETYDGSVDLPLLLHLAPKAAIGPASISIQVRYQACSDEICLPPVTRSVPLMVNIQHGSATHAKPPRDFTAAAKHT